MDNASKAILYAGAVLIAVGLISLLMFFFQRFRDFNTARNDASYSEEVKNFNRFFEESYYSIDGTYTSAGALINGYEVFNIISRIKDDNNRGNSYFEITYSGAPQIEAVYNQISNSRAQVGGRVRVDFSVLPEDQTAKLKARYRYSYKVDPGTGYIYEIRFVPS